MPNSTDMLESMTSAPVPTARVRTNEEGRFSVRELPNGPWVLVVRAPGFQLTAQHIVMTDVGPAGPPVDVRLVPRAPLHGRVVDEDGRGLEGARVALLVPARTVSAFFARHFEATDADGRFVLRTPPPPGPAQLVVLAKGYPALLRVVESSEPLRIVRRRDAEIRVVALDEHGRPVAGAHVAVVMGEEQDGPRAPQAVAHGRTDAAGVLVLPGRAGPVLAVLFDHPAHVRAVVSPHMPPSMPRAMEVAGMSEQGVRAGTNAWTLRLQPTVEVSGRVATEAGAPVADAVCHAFGPMGPVMTATSDAKGRYTLRMPRGMPAMVVVQAEGWLQQDGSVRVAAPGGSTEHATHDVVMLPAVRISGRVVDAGGQPLHGVQVRLVGTDPNNYDGLPGTPHPVTDAKGRYRFDTVRPGRRLHVEVRQRGRVGSQSAAFTLGEVAAHEIEDIVLRRGRSLDVTVVNEAGDPIEGAQVVPASVQGPDGAGLDEAALGRLITDAQGRARTPPLPEGAVVVTTYARGHAPKRQQVEVASVRGALRVRLQPGREMRGTILDADGQPLAGAMVTVRSSSPEGLPPYGALTDGKGHFVVGDLPPDVPLRVTVRHPTHERLEIDAAALEHELRLVARDDADPRTEADLQKEAHELQRRWVASQTDAERQVIEREMRDVMEALEALYVGAEEAR